MIGEVCNRDDECCSFACVNTPDGVKRCDYYHGTPACTVAGEDPCLPNEDPTDGYPDWTDPDSYCRIVEALLPQLERTEHYWEGKELRDAYRDLKPEERERAEALLEAGSPALAAPMPGRSTSTSASGPRWSPMSGPGRRILGQPRHPRPG